MKKSIFYLFLLWSLLTFQVVAQVPENRIIKRVDSLMQLMTVDEKIGQLNQYAGGVLTGPQSNSKTSEIEAIKKGNVGSILNVRGAAETRRVQGYAMQSRLKIPLLFGLDVIHGYKTVFPVALAEAASWDLEAIRNSARIAAVEASASGIHWTFAPMVDICRDPRWGRVVEGAGEDTYLGSKIAAARVRGFQNEHLGGIDAIMACAKHFAGYGASIAGRDYNAVDMSLNQFTEFYLPPFKAAKDAGVATFMTAFNTFNGIPSTGNQYLLQKILKKEWKYTGFVVSDWGAVGEMVQWGYANNNLDAAEKAINSGNDMDMESRIYIHTLKDLLANEKVTITTVNDAVRRILYKKFELGLFDDPYRFCNETREKKELNNPKHRIAALDIAQKSIVLLKNQSNILPLKPNIKKIALIGPLMKAKRDLEGGWIVNSDTSLVSNIADAVIANTNGKTEFLYAKGCNIDDDQTEGFDIALKIAKESDVIIMALGESWSMSGENKSKVNINLPGQQEELYKAISLLGKPTIVILLAGRPIIFNEISKNAQAILYAWLPGAEGGTAVANVLTGKYNPSGKLPISFPRSVGQIPIYYNYLNTGRPLINEKETLYKTSYLDSPNSPAYAFGFGLSYTSFEYSNLTLSQDSMRNADSILLSIKIQNTGQYEGEEVVQLYMRDLVASIARPVKELKDFQKVKLKPGQAKVITFTIDKEKLAFYDQFLDRITEPGEFDVMIGTASNDIKLNTKIKLIN